MHSKRKERGPQGGNRPLSCQERFPLLVQIVRPRPKNLTDSATDDPRLCPVRAPDPGPSDLLRARVQRASYS